MSEQAEQQGSVQPDAPQSSAEQTIFKPQIDLSGLAAAVEKLRNEVGKIIIGQHGLVDELIAALLAGGHVLIEGVPGVAKTLTAKLLARSTGLPFSRIQFTPDLMPADVIGTNVFSPKTSEFEFHRGPIFSSVVLIDEINRAPAKTQAALFEVMEERQITVDGKTYAMQEPFIVLATQNPIEHEGTYRLPEAQLDRFLFKVRVGYPSLDEEAQILERFQGHGGLVDVDRVSSVLSAAEILDAQAAVRKVRVEAKLLRYVAEIVASTRSHPALYLGGSPRASLAILIGAKAVAAMSGRDFATPEDVRAVVAPALRHRVILTPEKEVEGIRPSVVLKRIVEDVEVPR
ncbi:MAG: MoxR family ATPase [Rubricoccaceae bacterium]|nr:MoxR family ATPase [Rubricoccaceae bacterium]